ncbi:MAG: diacylglycerol kinase family lipid kinase [Erysipelotrichaceae bacterium]|nr:diacylglycerol kinase family lipid kinase [Erysipelotrichaceae bacterium]
MKHVFVVNPISGRGAAKELVEPIREVCERRGLNYEIRVTRDESHGIRIAASYTKEDDVCLYAVGGDGTLWNVISGVTEGVQFAVIPAGTGNDFFRNLNRSQYDLMKLLEDTIDGEVIPVDYGTINDEVRFVNQICFGFDAEINLDVCEKGKKSLMPKKFLYGTTAVRKAVSPKTVHYWMEYDGKREEYTRLVTTIQNGRYYGGGFYPAPMADIDDGVFNLVAIGKVNTVQLIPLIAQYKKGEHLKNKKVTVHELTDCRFEFDEEINVAVDGELFKFKTMDIKMHHGGLLLRLPKESYHANRE